MYLKLLFFLWLGSIHAITIMINPAGDAKYAGRTINDYFERGISLQAAEQLKRALEQLHSGVHVMLTRMPGETVEPLHNARLANRLAPDLYISLHFFHEEESLGSVFIYYALYNPITDFWYKNQSELSCMPYNHAHVISLPTSKQLAQNLAQSLKNKLPAITVHDALGIPFKPLIGIAVPALALEIGIQKKTDCDMYIPSIAHSLLAQVFNAYKN